MTKPPVNSLWTASRLAQSETDEVLRRALVRFLQAQVFRWVDRVDDHRCIMSCPAADLQGEVLNLAAAS